MPSSEEKAAGRVAIVPTLHELTNAFVPDMFGYRQKISNAIDNDPQVSDYIDQGVEEVLVAAEHVREGKTPPAPKAVSKLEAVLKGYIHGTDIPDRPDTPGQN